MLLYTLSRKANMNRPVFSYKTENKENTQPKTTPPATPIPAINHQELLKKYEVLKKQGDSLKQKKTELLTKLKIAKENSQKIADEIKKEYDIDNPEKFAQWLAEQKQEQAENLKKYEEQLVSAQEKLSEIESKLK